MTEVTEEQFLARLLEVVSKLVSIIKQQVPRYEKIWNDYFGTFDIKPHVIRKITLDKDKFIQDIDYRIQILESMVNAFIDGYYSIKSILEAFYHHCVDSEKFIKDFSEEDRLLLEYIVARKILGDLVQYNKMDHETVPLHYNIIAREYLMLKMKGLTLEDIAASLNKLNKNVAQDTLIKLMEDIKEDGFIDITPEGDTFRYTLRRPLELSEEGDIMYTSTFRSIIEWPTQFWRSFYNIRELNFTPKDCPYNESLIKILSKSATQGFGPCQFVFKGLVNYFNEVKKLN